MWRSHMWGSFTLNALVGMEGLQSRRGKLRAVYEYPDDLNGIFS